MISLVIPGKPMSKQRARVMRNGITFTPKETVNYENLIKQLYIQNNLPKLQGQIGLIITVYYPIPSSKSKKVKQDMLEGKIRPQVKPDVDNVIKLIMDALNGIAYNDDKDVVYVMANKWYDENPRVEIQIAGGQV